MWWLVPIAQAFPPSTKTCDELSRAFAPREVPPPPPESPDFWWMEADPCPYGPRAGTPPPTGDDVWCTQGDERSGRRTRFVDGRVSVDTWYVADVEVGPRIVWDPATGRVVSSTPIRRGMPHGVAVEWREDGTLQSRWVNGLKDGPSWAVDERGQLMAVEYWDGGVRAGRSCAWREGVLQIDHWIVKEPTPKK